MKTYRTIQGDMWDAIAHKQLGDVKYTDVLIRANLKYHDVFIFPAGVELVIPSVEAIDTPVTLPPWKQVNR